MTLKLHDPNDEAKDAGAAPYLGHLDALADAAVRKVPPPVPAKREPMTVPPEQPRPCKLRPVALGCGLFLGVSLVGFCAAILGIYFYAYTLCEIPLPRLP